MIASQQVEVLRELDLVSQQQGYGLNALFSSVNVVADEQEFLVIFWVSSDIKQSEQVEVLAVNVAEHFYRSLKI